MKRIVKHFPSVHIVKITFFSLSFSSISFLKRKDVLHHIYENSCCNCNINRTTHKYINILLQSSYMANNRAAGKCYMKYDKRGYELDRNGIENVNKKKNRKMRGKIYENGKIYTCG